MERHDAGRAIVLLRNQPISQSEANSYCAYSSNKSTQGTGYEIVSSSLISGCAHAHQRVIAVAGNRVTRVHVCMYVCMYVCSLAVGATYLKNAKIKLQCPRSSRMLGSCHSRDITRMPISGNKHMVRLPTSFVRAKPSWVQNYDFKGVTLSRGGGFYS